MAFYESPDVVAKNQKTIGILGHKIEVFEKMLLEEKKELELARNWDFDKELAKRMEEHKRLKTLDPAIRKRNQMSKEEICERVRLSMCERKLTVDRSVFRQDIDSDLGRLGKSKVRYWRSSTPRFADDDAYRSVTDKLMETDFLKADKSSTDDPDKLMETDFLEADKSSTDDPAEFVKEPQDAVEKGKDTL